MKKGLNEIIAIIDRSGSMGAVVDDAIGGLNEFIKSQQDLLGKARMTIILFDHEYKVDVDGIDIKNVKFYDNKTYVPRGTTALLDAVGRAIITVGERLDNMPDDEKPEKVIMAVLTDGQENASVEYTKPKILDMINHQRDKYSWEFIYLSADPNAFNDAGALGFNIKDIYKYDSNDTKKGYKLYTQTVSSYRV